MAEKAAKLAQKRMDSETEKMLVQAIIARASLLGEAASGEGGVLAYLRRPPVPPKREKLNERFLHNTLRGVFSSNRRSQQQEMWEKREEQLKRERERKDQEDKRSDERGSLKRERGREGPSQGDRDYRPSGRSLDVSPSDKEHGSKGFRGRDLESDRHNHRERSRSRSRERSRSRDREKASLKRQEDSGRNRRSNSRGRLHDASHISDSVKHHGRVSSRAFSPSSENDTMHNQSPLTSSAYNTDSGSSENSSDSRKSDDHDDIGGCAASGDAHGEEASRDLDGEEDVKRSDESNDGDEEECWVMTDEELQAMLNKHRVRGRGGVGIRSAETGPYLPEGYEATRSALDGVLRGPAAPSWLQQAATSAGRSTGAPATDALLNMDMEELLKRLAKLRKKSAKKSKKSKKHKKDKKSKKSKKKKHHSKEKKGRDDSD